MTLCACGCGGEIVIKPHHKYYGIPRFIRWHASKTKETKKKNSKAHKGISVSEKTKKRISLALKGQIAWNKGIPCTEEQKRKISVANQGKISSLKGILQSEEHKRKNSEARKSKTCGKKHYNWQGGISFLPYCEKFNKALKIAVKERDNHTCQLCGATDKKLAVHHVHYDKENCYPDLITLCHQPCNTKVNSNRKHYEELFMNKLNDREFLFWTQNYGRA